MTTREQFRQAVELLDSLEAVLTAPERDEIVHLIRHNEIGEALRTLAWIIVEGNKSGVQSGGELTDRIAECVDRHGVVGGNECARFGWRRRNDRCSRHAAW